MSRPGGEHVVPWLDAYRTGELELARAGEVERHLAACPACEARLAELRAFAVAVERGFEAERRLASGAEPDWERQRRAILVRTTGVEGAGRAGQARPARRPFLLRNAPQLGMAAVAMIVVGILVREGVHRPADAERRLKEAALDTAPPGQLPTLEAPAAPSLRPEERSEKAAAEVPASEREAGFAGEPAPEADARTELPPAGEQRDLRRAPGAAAEDARAQAAPQAADEAARRAAPSPPAAGRQEGLAMEESKAAEGRPDSLAAGELADRANVAPWPREAAPGDDLLQRLDLHARRALATEDSLDAALALAFWRDSVAGRDDLDPARMRAAAALADSVAALGGGAARPHVPRRAPEAPPE